MALSAFVYGWGEGVKIRRERSKIGQEKKGLAIILLFRLQRKRQNERKKHTGHSSSVGVPRARKIVLS